MTTAVERKYALTKVAPGDYLLPSNDGRTIWRIAKYREDIPEGFVGMYWGLWRAEFPYGGYVDTGDWDRWQMVEGACETRAAAIVRAMEMA